MSNILSRLVSRLRALWATLPGFQFDNGADTTAATWNDFAVDAAWDPKTPAAQLPYYVYAASKTEGEREAWSWFEKNKPNFTLNTVLPDVNVRIFSLPG